MSESFEQQNTSEANEEGASSSTTCKTRSNTWLYFTRLPNGEPRASCNSCGQTYSTKTGTTNMLRHIEQCFEFSDVSLLRQKRVRLDQDLFKEKIAISIIKHNYPFSYVEHDGTRELLQFLHPDAQPICRNTAKAEVLRIYKREKMKLKENLENVTSRICLTSDLWTSVTTDGYMTLTAHYIDESWVLRKQVLNFRVVHPPHSGRLLAECINNFLKDWGIEKKVFTITLDNAAYNNGVVDCLKDHLRLNNALVCDGEYLHVRCGAHVLNLIVQSGLKVIEEAIVKVRESVKYVRGGAQRKRKFAQCITHLSLKCGRHVRQDIVTRWNFTYLMLDCALVYERAYARLKLVDSNYKTCPTELEWERIREITKILKPFYDITTLFSGTSYPTSNLYFLNVWKIQLHIQEAMESLDPVISVMAKEMKTKFEKYWDTYSMILSFGIILDPRYKLKMVEYCFDKLGIEGEMLSHKVGSVESGLRELYKGYKVRADEMPDLNLATSQNVANPSDYLVGFESYKSRYDKNVEETSQLDKYLAEPPLDRFQHADLNILQYWKENQGRYPEVARMARDVLSIPITTVASESSFSIGGRIISKYRSSLLSDNVEALLCTRDWIFDQKDEAEERLDQEIEKRLIEDIENVI